jgi:hypothetical protein
MSFALFRERVSLFITPQAPITIKPPDKPHLGVTVPYHNRDLKRGTLQSIIKQSGIPLDEFPSLL